MRKGAEPIRGDRVYARSIFHRMAWKIDRARLWALGTRDDPRVSLENATSL
jgi:hypothetical protein